LSIHGWLSPSTWNLHRSSKRRWCRPALAAVALPASRRASAYAPAVRGVRLDDLRHTFPTLQRSAGVHFMQVSKWLGHSTFTLTLDIDGDWIPEQDGGVANALPELIAPRGSTTDSVATLPTRRRAN
jgi:integrase